MEPDNLKERRTILICGGGIAGLASALFASRAGYRVEIFEQAEQFDPIGAGLQLSPNAMQVLAALGLDRQIKTVASAPLSIEVNSAKSGRKIVEIPLGTQMIASFGQPYLVIHRADLHKILLSACQRQPDIEIRMGARIRDAVAHPNGISIIVDLAKQAQNFTGAALIGADGVNSVVRNECFECAQPIDTGTTALRALVRTDQLPATFHNRNVRMWLSPDGHAVVYPIRAEQYHNIIITVPKQFTQPLARGGSHYGAKLSGAFIGEGLKDWCAEFLLLLDVNTHWTDWPLFTCPPLKTWQEGSIVLIGDAAHAMTPHAAQGAAMGLEDAGVLGWALKQNTSIEKAFMQYCKAREKRTEAVKRFSEKNKVIYQLPDGLSQLRNLGMKMLGGARLLNRQDWIYKWRMPES